MYIRPSRNDKDQAEELYHFHHTGLHTFLSVSDKPQIIVLQYESGEVLPYVMTVSEKQTLVNCNLDKTATAD